MTAAKSLSVNSIPGPSVATSSRINEHGSHVLSKWQWLYYCRLRHYQILPARLWVVAPFPDVPSCPDMRVHSLRSKRLYHATMAQKWVKREFLDPPPQKKIKPQQTFRHHGTQVIASMNSALRPNYWHYRRIVWRGKGSTAGAVALLCNRS
jgi:hypothetical protein